VDGARIVEMPDVLDETYGKGVLEGAQKLKTLQPHAHDGSRRFYLAVVIGLLWAYLRGIVVLL
jgi:hypothetical protein